MQSTSDSGTVLIVNYSYSSSRSRQFQERKRNPNPNFLVRIFSSGVGVFHVNGWGPKSSICPSKPGKSNFLGGISRDFAGISRGCPKSLRKKSLCSISGPHNWFMLQFQHQVDWPENSFIATDSSYSFCFEANQLTIAVQYWSLS